MRDVGESTAQTHVCRPAGKRDKLKDQLITFNTDGMVYLATGLPGALTSTKLDEAVPLFEQCFTEAGRNVVTAELTRYCSFAHDVMDRGCAAEALEVLKRGYGNVPSMGASGSASRAAPAVQQCAATACTDLDAFLETLTTEEDVVKVMDHLRAGKDQLYRTADLTDLAQSRFSRFLDRVLVAAARRTDDPPRVARDTSAAHVAVDAITVPARRNTWSLYIADRAVQLGLAKPGNEQVAEYRSGVRNKMPRSHKTGLQAALWLLQRPAGEGADAVATYLAELLDVNRQRKKRKHNRADPILLPAMTVWVQTELADFVRNWATVAVLLPNDMSRESYETMNAEWERDAKMLSVDAQAYLLVMGGRYSHGSAKFP